MKKLLFAAMAAFVISFAASSCGGSAEGDQAVKDYKELVEKLKSAKESGDLAKVMEVLEDAQKFADKYKNTKLSSSQEAEIEKAMKEIEELNK
jgi:ABC-type phosphate/phosphonate transport system substrate-binding protein